MDKLQIKIDVFVGRCMGWYGYNKEQIIGFTMLEFNILYDEAKNRVSSSLNKVV